MLLLEIESAKVKVSYSYIILTDFRHQNILLNIYNR